MLPPFLSLPTPLPHTRPLPLSSSPPRQALDLPNAYQQYWRQNMTAQNMTSQDRQIMSDIDQLLQVLATAPDPLSLQQLHLLGFKHVRSKLLPALRGLFLLRQFKVAGKGMEDVGSRQRDGGFRDEH